MKPAALNFRVKLDDPFQEKLEEAIKGMRHGTRNLFLINLCRTLFGDMDEAEMKEAMTAISSSKTELVEELFTRALHRFEAGRSFEVMNEVEVRPMPEALLPPKRPTTAGPPSLKSLSIGDD